MDNSNVIVREVNEERPPPPRVCPRCFSHNTRFSYYNNYSVSQPRYTCRKCRRDWTHGGALRNVPIGGRSRKTKLPKTCQPFLSQVVSAQQTNNFLGSFRGFVMLPFGSVPPMDYHVGSNDLVGNPMINRQVFGGRINNYSSYLANHEDPNKGNQSFDNTMNMNHDASTSGSREYQGTDGHMIRNNNNI